MPFTVQMTGTNEIAPAILQALGASFVAAQARSLFTQLPVTQLASSLDKTQFTFGKINEIDSSVSAVLAEYDDPASVALSAASTTINAVELGRVVTTTSRADAISGGALGRQAAAAVGRDAARYLDITLAKTLAAGTNALFAGTAGTSAGLAATDVMTPSLMNRAYYFLSKSLATKDADGYYTAILTSAQIFDLKNATGAGSWTDVWKYADPAQVMSGEVGRAFGFKIIESNLVPIVNQASGTVDVNPAIFLGANGLGRGVTVAPTLGIAFTDKMNRFAHYSWYAIEAMGITDQTQVYVVNTASSLGANAA